MLINYESLKNLTAELFRDIPKERYISREERQIIIDDMVII